MPLTAAGNDWKQLFNGKDLTGWTHVDKGHMTVANGLIQTHAGMGLLYWTGGKIGNCQLRVVYGMRDHNDNSGVYVRIPIEPKEAWMPVYYGYEVQIDNEPEKGGEDDYHATGCLYSLTKALARRQAWAGVEHDGDYARRSSHDCDGQWRKSDRLYRRPTRSA